MKKIFETVKFNLVLFFNSTRFIIPLLANVIFLFLMYYGNNRTYDISTVLFITVYFSFFLMLWVGNSIISLKNERLDLEINPDTNNLHIINIINSRNTCHRWTKYNTIFHFIS